MFSIFAIVAVLLGTLATGTKPDCMLQDFSQRRLMYGNLERKAGNRGRLSFKVDPTEVLHIFFRIHPRK
jgi:hypothetical protein